MTRLRVLQIVDNLGMGGAETWLIALLRLWKDDPGAPHIEFLATGTTPGALEGEARDLGAHIHHLRYSQARLVPFTAAFRRLLCVGHYDALHDHQDYASGWHFMLAGGTAPKVLVTHVHNPAYQVAENYSRSLRHALTGRIGMAMIARYATYIAGTSRQVISEHGFDAPVFHHIPKIALHCGFDPDPFAADRETARADVRREFGWSEDVRIALFAGRIDVSPDPDHARNHKNSGFALSIALAACAGDPDLAVLFAGPPSPATPILNARITAAGLSDRIILLGIRRDMPRLMRGSDALLFPSRSEGLGMVAVEAQSAGLPVLASTEVPRECVVVPELVTFMDVRDGALSWAQALTRIAASPRFSRDPQALIVASDFAIRNSAARLAALYAGRLMV